MITKEKKVKVSKNTLLDFFSKNPEYLKKIFKKTPKKGGGTKRKIEDSVSHNQDSKLRKQLNDSNDLNDLNDLNATFKIPRTTVKQTTVKQTHEYNFVDDFISKLYNIHTNNAIDKKKKDILKSNGKRTFCSITNYENGLFDQVLKILFKTFEDELPIKPIPDFNYTQLKIMRHFSYAFIVKNDNNNYIVRLGREEDFDQFNYTTLVLFFKHFCKFDKDFEDIFKKLYKREEVQINNKQTFLENVRNFNDKLDEVILKYYILKCYKKGYEKFLKNIQDIFNQVESLYIYNKRIVEEKHKGKGKEKHEGKDKEKHEGKGKEKHEGKGKENHEGKGKENHEGSSRDGRASQDKDKQEPNLMKLFSIHSTDNFDLLFMKKKNTFNLYFVLNKKSIKCSFIELSLQREYLYDRKKNPIVYSRSRRASGGSNHVIYIKRFLENINFNNINENLIRKITDIKGINNVHFTLIECEKGFHYTYSAEGLYIFFTDVNDLFEMYLIMTYYGVKNCITQGSKNNYIDKILYDIVFYLVNQHLSISNIDIDKQKIKNIISENKQKKPIDCEEVSIRL